MARINPITKLDYPDVDVIRVGDTYYMVSTTMHFFPGCEILRSYDLIHWEHASFVYDRLDSTPEQTLTGTGNIYGKGMWAASLRFHNGIFYVCFVANDTGKTYLYQAEKVDGPWKKSYIEGFYHDCSLLFDEDDRVYIAYGNKEIYLTELKPDLSGPLEGGIHRVVVSDAGNPKLGYEGTHFYKINGKYYLFFIHSLKDRWRRVEACFVADSLDSEFMGDDVLNDDMGYCNQGVAQGGIVDTPDGAWYAILFQDRGAIGRIPVLIPVTWKDDFPVFGENGKVPDSFPVSSTRPDYVYQPLVESDDFKQKYGGYGLKSCWQFNHEPDMKYVYHDTEKGCWQIENSKLCVNLTQAKNTITQRMKYPKCAGEITVDASGLRDGDFAGICALQGCYAMAAVTKLNGGYYLVMMEHEPKDDSLMGESKDETPGVERERVSLQSPKVRLRLEADFTMMKDEAALYYEKDGQWHQIGPKKKLYFKLDHFTGCRFGLFSYATQRTGGKASFSDFIYES